MDCYCILYWAKYSSTLFRLRSLNMNFKLDGLKFNPGVLVKLFWFMKLRSNINQSGAQMQY